MSLKVMQTNLGRGRAAHDLAYATARKEGVDILLVGEPNKTITKGGEWIKDERGDVAVLLINKKVIVTQTKAGKGYVSISLEGCELYCCYISPNIELEEYKEKVDEIANHVRAGKKEAIIAGDLNAKSPLWESPVNDKRGEYWAEWIAALELVVHNAGGMPTFVRGNTESYIDVTLSTQKISTRVANWKILEEESLTEHRLIYYEVKLAKAQKKMINKQKFTTDWDAYNANLEIRLCNMSKQERSSHSKCTEIIKNAYAHSIVKVSGSKKKVPYWWKEAISQKRNQCTVIRRWCTRMSRRGLAEDQRLQAHRKYKEGKKELRKLISLSKKEHWNKLCADLNNDIWGDGYKIAIKGISNIMPYDLPDKERREIARNLFICSEKEVHNYRKKADKFPAFTATELSEAINNMKPGKAPGLDGVPVEVIKETERLHGDWLLDVMNQLLCVQKFPREWKVAKVILIPKEGKGGRKARVRIPEGTIDVASSRGN